VEEDLIPTLHEWEIELLQRNGKNFLLCLYDDAGKKLIGSVIGEKINTFRFNKHPHLGARLLRYIVDNEPHGCIVCEQEKHEGWLWQQNLEYFICTGCSQKN